MISVPFSFPGRLYQWLFVCLGLCVSCNSEPAVIDYQPQPTGSSSYWITYNSINSELPDDALTHIAIGAQDVVWLGLQKGGLVRFNGSQWTHFTAANSPLPADQINELASDGNDGVWIATPTGLAHLNSQGWSVFHSANSPLPNKEILTLAVAPNGDLWLSVRAPRSNQDSLGHLMRFDGQTWSIFHKDNSPIVQTEALTRLHIAPDGSLWGGYAAKTGLVRRTAAGEWTIFDQTNTGFLIPATGALATDSRGRLWVGIDYAAAGLTDPVRPLLLRRESLSWKVETPHNNGILYEGITALAAARADTVWAIADQDLARFDGFDWRVWSWASSDFPRTGLHDLAIDSQNRLWVVTDQGIMVIDR